MMRKLGVAAAIVALLTGCGKVRDCKQGTVLLAIDLGPTAAQADGFNLTLALDDGRTLNASAAHAVGAASGTLEITFPDGYPAGHSATITISATSAGQSVAQAMVGPTLLQPTCTLLPIQVGAVSDGGGAGDADGHGGVVVMPATVTLARGTSQLFTANVDVTWSIDEGANGGTIDASGFYTAPQTPGIYHVTATSKADAAETGSASVTVTGGPVVQVVAGAIGGRGLGDGVGSSARFDGPVALTADGSGNLFVADGSIIRKVAVAASSVSRFAGGGPNTGIDGVGSAASFFNPTGIAFDASGNLFVADTNDATIRKVVISSSTVSTVAGQNGMIGTTDGTGSVARFAGPHALADDGTRLFIADNNAIRVMVIATAAVTTLSGLVNSSGSIDGAAGSARFSGPRGIATDGTSLYVADTGNHTIRKVAIADGSASTIAGSAGTPGSADGTGAAARFNAPAGLLLAAGQLYIADSGNNTIRRLDVGTNAVMTIAGTAGVAGSTDATGLSATFSSPSGLVGDASGNLFVADKGNFTIRRLVLSSAVVTTVAGTAPHVGATDAVGTAALFNNPSGIATDGTAAAYICDKLNHTIRKLNLSSGAVTTIAGKAGMAGSADGVGVAALFTQPYGAALVGNDLFVTDSGNNTIRQIDLTNNAVTTFAGTAGTPGSSDGTGSAALFKYPLGITTDKTGGLFVTDANNHTIRRIDVAGAAVTTLAGSPGTSGNSDGTGSAALFYDPFGITYDGSGSLYVADSFNQTIRRVVISSRAVTTVAGAAGITGALDGLGSVARFNAPLSIVHNGADVVYIADTGNATVRKLVVSTNTVTTLAGSPLQSGVMPGLLPGRLNGPLGLSVLTSGDILLLDENAVLRIRLN